MIRYDSEWPGRGEPRAVVVENGRTVARFDTEAERDYWARVEYGDETADVLARDGESANA